MGTPSEKKNGYPAHPKNIGKRLNLDQLGSGHCHGPLGHHLLSVWDLGSCKSSANLESFAHLAFLWPQASHWPIASIKALLGALLHLQSL